MLNSSIPWPPDTKKLLIGKDPDAGNDRRQEVKGMTENEMVKGTDPDMMSEVQSRMTGL